MFAFKIAKLAKRQAQLELKKELEKRLTHLDKDETHSIKLSKDEEVSETVQEYYKNKAINFGERFDELNKLYEFYFYESFKPDEEKL